MRLTNPLSAAIVSSLILLGCSGNSADTIEASGTIEGTDVNIGTEVAGRVKEVRVDEGAKVSKGDTLLIIDDADYQIQLRQALGNFAAADAQYRLAVQGSRKEDILQAEAAFKSAQGDYSRMKELLASKTVTQKQFDDAEARYISAQQTYEKLKTGLRSDEIVAARARRDQAAAQADQLRKKVSDCYILAPSSGTVTLRAVEPGELVTMGANILRITYLEKVKLTIYVNEADLGRIRLGQEASVKIDSDEERSHTGRIVYISPTAEFTPKNVQTKEERTKLVFGVKIEVDNKDGVLKPGLPADATIRTAQGN
ncbi:MAG TPA: efflux RND transporter periplasmic adaptor subunit [Bacteroidota bacterium]|nr:efflux RND transporter periplasmic adaptor subunit [Bacteroidota bacterium]